MTEETKKEQKLLQPGQVKGPYKHKDLWFYETVELGRSCSFSDQGEAEKNIEAYRAWFDTRK